MISFLRFNHDYANVIAYDPSEFTQALLDYLRHPTEGTKNKLIEFGVVVAENPEHAAQEIRENQNGN